MKHLLVFGAFTCLAALTAAEIQELRRPLEKSKIVRVEGLTVTGVALPVKCDPDGNIVTRLLDGSDITSVPLVRISTDGRQPVKFMIPSDPEFKGGHLVDFAPIDGGLYAIFNAADSFILKFDADGTFTGKIKVEPVIRPLQIAIFRSGELLLAGKERTQGPGQQQTNPFIGLFTGNGRLIRAVHLADDVTRSKNAEVPGVGVQPAPYDRDFENAIAASFMTGADDGNVYLLRRTSIGPIYQISASGVVKKLVSLTTPDSMKNSGMLAVGHGQLVVEFLKFKPASESNELESVVLRVIDIGTGKTVADYTHSDPDIGSSLACYSDGVPVFLSTDDNSRLVLVQTSYK